MEDRRLDRARRLDRKAARTFKTRHQFAHLDTLSKEA